MKLKPRTPMTGLDAHVYGRLGAVSMQPASADKRFRHQLAERNVAVVGLTDGERKHMHDLAHKYRSRSDASATRSSRSRYGSVSVRPIAAWLRSADMKVEAKDLGKAVRINTQAQADALRRAAFVRSRGRPAWLRTG